MSRTTLKLEKLTCPSCMHKITNSVSELEGVETTKILFDASKARVIYNDQLISEENIVNQIKSIGYQAEVIK